MNSQSMSSRAELRAFSLRMLFSLLGLFLACNQRSFGQASVGSNSATDAQSNAAQSSAILQLATKFQTEQAALAASFHLLLAQNPSEDQIENWRQQNAAELADLQQVAQTISSNQPTQPLSYITDIYLPKEASQAEEDFLNSRVNLQNARAEIHNRMLGANKTVDDGQVEAMFEQENADALQVQGQGAQIVAQEAAAQSLPEPPPLVTPPNVSSTLKEFLELRDQLIRGEIAVHNQNLTVSPDDRETAIQQWKDQNADAFAQLRSLAQALADNP